MYHQCFKAVWKDKKIHFNASECSFQQDEAHFSKEAFLMGYLRMERFNQLDLKVCLSQNQSPLSLPQIHLAPNPRSS